MKLKIWVCILKNLVCVSLILLCAQSAESSSWQVMPGRARDIGIGNGSIWIIGSTPIGAGYGIYRWTGANWYQVDDAAVAIDVDPSGTPWVVNSEGAIYRREGNRWQIQPGKARDIGIGGSDGSVWVIGWTRIAGGGYGIYRWTGSNWRQIDGAAIRISVDPSGRPWVVNSAGNIYKHR